MEIEYLLADDGGINILHLPILLELHSIFHIEYGVYEVTDYTIEFNEIKTVICERITKLTTK
jgi:hypothetical protein